MTAVLLSITVGGAVLGSAVVDRHRAQAAADLAALAAAARLANGAGVACAHASTVAQAMDATIASCVVDDLDVIVAVEVDVALGRFAVGPARAQARAGPADTAG
jgi:secretion/DNA translocation related TadE-like protein